MLWVDDRLSMGIQLGCSKEGITTSAHISEARRLSIPMISTFL